MSTGDYIVNEIEGAMVVTEEDEFAVFGPFKVNRECEDLLNKSCSD